MLKAPWGWVGVPIRLGEVNGCCLASSEGREAVIKPQKLPWSCACKHCGVNVPPSGPPSRLKGLLGRRVRKYSGLRDSDTEGLRGETGMGLMQRARWRPRGKGTEKTETEMWKERKRQTKRTLKTETEVQKQRRTGTGQRGGAQNSDGADGRGSGADWKERSSADATAVALGPQAPTFPMGLLIKRLYPSILVLINSRSPGERVAVCAVTPLCPFPGTVFSHCHYLLFSFVAGGSVCSLTS